MNHKPNPWFAVSGKFFDVENVQGGRSSAGINFDFDSTDTEIGKLDPFSPADHRQVFDISNSGCHVFGCSWGGFLGFAGPKPRKRDVAPLRLPGPALEISVIDWP